MSLPSTPPLLRPDTAILLVLMPQVSGRADSLGAQSSATIRWLQGRLAPGIKVLKIEEASHPAVVRSFGPPELPACVLLRHGVELWRQQGLPEDESVIASLLEAARAQ